MGKLDPNLSSNTRAMRHLDFVNADRVSEPMEPMPTISSRQFAESMGGAFESGTGDRRARLFPSVPAPWGCPSLIKVDRVATPQDAVSSHGDGTESRFGSRLPVPGLLQTRNTFANRRAFPDSPFLDASPVSCPPLVHAILGVRAPTTLPAGGRIPRVAWTRISPHHGSK
jgi:hypothetical protein